MAKYTYNWYIVLGLEFDPPVTDQNAIDAKIEEKKKFWSQKSNDMRHGQEYRKYLELARKGTIKNELDDEDLRKQMIADAKDQQYGSVDEILEKFFRTEVPQDKIDEIAKQAKVSRVVVEKRIRDKGRKITAPKHADAKQVVDKYYTQAPNGADAYRLAKSNLATMKVKNLYEFLTLGTTINEKDYRHRDCKTLVAQAQKLKKEKYNKADAESSAGSKLCAQCEKAFASESSKAEYDAFLEYDDRKTVLDDVRQTKQLGGLSDKAVYTGFLDKLTAIFKDRKLARKVLDSFCVVNQIPFPDDNSNTDEEDKKISICRCGCINHVPEGTQGYCTDCGRPLLIKCPSCGTMNPNRVNACPKCGFRYENMDKAEAACDEAEESLRTVNFEAAKYQLNLAESFWKGYERIAKIRQSLDTLQSQLGNIASEMDKACGTKRYYEARNLLSKIRQFAPSYKNDAREAEISSAIAEAEKYKKTAQSSTDEDAVIDACTKAYEACTDCPGIQQIMASHKPAAPQNIRTSVNPANKVNVVAWDPASGKNAGAIYYVVRRKEGAKPISATDGDLVGRVSGTSVNDMKISAGVEYYYAVYTERAGIYSQSGAVTAKPVVNLFEIAGVRTVAGDGTVELSWNEPAENATPEVTRIENGKPAKVNVTNRTGYLDKGLSNDRTYTYQLKLVYQIGMSRQETAGVEVSATPTRPPLPIEHVSLKSSDNGTYELKWDNRENADVRFYYSGKRPEYVIGDLISVAELEKTMKEMPVQKKGSDSGTFRYASDDTIYLMAVVIKSGSAVAGDIVRVSKGGSVKIDSVYKANGKIAIKTTLPKECTGFIVLYRHDHYPDGLDDREASRKYVAKKQFEYDNSLMIDDDGKGPVYITVFAEFRHVGEDTDYSEGTDCELSDAAEKVTVYYEIHVSKKLFGTNISVTFSSDKKDFELPDINVMSAIGAAPMFAHSATMYQSIQGGEVSGSKTVSLDSRKVAKNTYIKPFLADEDRDKSRYVLKLRGTLTPIS